MSVSVQGPVDFSAKKLGVVNAHYNVHALQFSDYFDRKTYREHKAELHLHRLATPSALSVPSSVDNLQGMTFATDGNDRYGDCVEAAAAHMEEEWRNRAGHPLTYTVNEVLAAYTAVTGFNPNVPSSDQGTDPEVFLNWWKTTGYTGPDGVNHKIVGWVQVNPADMEAIEAGIDFFGMTFAAVNLPNTAKTQSVWDVPANQSGDGAPGSWGGHMISPGYYDPSKIEFPTWGEILGATKAFVNVYFAVVYVVFSQDQLNDQGLSPLGFNAAQLQQDLGNLDNPPVPTPTPTPKPDPIAVAWLGWQQTVADYVNKVYAAGDLVDAQTWQAQLNQYEPGIAALIAGETSVQHLPSLVPSLPPVTKNGHRLLGSIVKDVETVFRR